MNNYHIEKCKIDDTSIDFNLTVPIYEIMRLLQMATFVHADMSGLDHDSMLNKSNAFWIVTKMKVEISDDILPNEKVKVITWTNPPSMLRVNRNVIIKSSRKTKVKASSEWCCLDAENRKPRKLSSINYPDFDVRLDTSKTTPFTNLKLDVDASDYCYTKIVRSTDIDVNNHTNNLKYNVMAMDCFSVEELRDKKVKEYEIYYVNESHENDSIDIYKKKQGKYYYIEGRIKDKTIFRVVIRFSNKKRALKVKPF